MILLDPDLEPDSAPRTTPAKRTTVSVSGKNLRLPAARALARFLAEA